MFRSLRSLLLLVVLSFLFVSGCKDSSLTVIEQQNENQSLSKSAPMGTLAITSEGFETGSKTAYAAADVTLGSGVWNMNDALIGTTTSDVKNGTASARVRNSGAITMKFDRTTGASTVTIKHAKYGSDASTTWGLWFSTNSGSTWAQTGSSVTTSTTTLATASFTVNIAGTIRFDIRKSDGTTNRTNIDDITINDYVVNNPVPSATSLSPASATAGGSAFTLTVTGSSFISSSVVKWNGTSLTTTYVSGTSIKGAVTAAMIATAGTATVTVFNPTPGGGTSGGLTFTINAGSNNPVPVATTLNPSSAAKGGSAFTLTVTGSSFISSSVVKWNGTSLTTTYVSGTSIKGAVTAAMIATAGTATVTVFNPTPGGGTSAGLTFSIYTVSSNVNLTMGNPTGATTDVNYPANYLLDKPQFCASYNRDRGIANWVAWQLNSTWCNGPGVRQDNFIPDAILPSSWYHVVTGDYTGSGFSRGHMCPSADRINTQANNDALFVMTNMVPQNQTNNAGPWEALETYERTLANAGNVLYIYCGGYGSGGTGTNGTATTIAGGKVTVPSKVWKVILVLPAGTNDVSRVTTSTRCIAVVMNNDNGPFNNWGTYRVSVDAVEALTGFDFYSNVSTSIQSVIESKVDNGPTQ
jgi:DNA/RNA endonuclease G (NUC1)